MRRCTRNRARGAPIAGALREGAFLAGRRGVLSVVRSHGERNSEATMAEGLNKVMLLGNLGQDPELRYTQGGQAVLNLRIATNESFQNRDGERQERTEWHQVIIWGKRGEGLSKVLTKGKQLFIEGRLQTRSWEDKQGQKRYTTEIVATEVILLGGGGAGRGPTRSYDGPQDAPDDDMGGGGARRGGGGGRGEGSFQDDDDIPF
jgi:single-strand DNA-binding protein